jgi:hypothetical protein
MPKKKDENAPRKTTHSFCITDGAWNTIYQYALLNHLSFSNALCELIIIAREKLRDDQRRSL